MVEAIPAPYGGKNEGAAAALQFAFLKQNEITVTEEAMEFLGQFPCDQKLSIVTLVGPTNSGKSFLANKLVGVTGDKACFPTRDVASATDPSKTATSHTNGIMMWNRPMKLKDGSLMLVLDMQGLPPAAQPAATTSSLRSPRTSALRSPRGLAQRNQPTDRLMAFITLISSLVVYTQRSGGKLDPMIECLDPITKFSDHIQRELNAENGASASILSTSSAGNMSARSFGGSTLDITTTVASDLKDIVCSSLLCVMRDFSLTKEQENEGLTQRKAAKNALTGVFSPSSGVTTDTIRKNKTVECLKNIFPHRYVHSISASEADSTKDLSRFVSTIKRKAVPKKVCGKALNGNMFLAMSLEYAETLSQPAQSSMQLPNAKSSYYNNLVLLFQAFSRVAEEETLRIFDLLLEEFEQELNQRVNDQTMPLSEKSLNKTFNELEQTYKARLRKDMAEIATFDEVMFETEKLDDRMKQIFESKRAENYSQGYYFAVGLLKQLYDQEFLETELDHDGGIKKFSAAEFKDKWLKLSNDFKMNSGENSLAKWDVFAECLIRLPAEELTRFVDYSKVEVELVTDLNDDEDTLNSVTEVKRNGQAPSVLLNSQVQIMSLIESQIENMKQTLEEELTQSQVQAQKVFQNHQELENIKTENERKMDEMRKQRDELVLNKNDIELKIQAVERERQSIQEESESMNQLLSNEQLKHKAQIDKVSGVAEVELAEKSKQADKLRLQLQQLEEQLHKEESEMRSEVSLLETEIQESRDESDNMAMTLAQRDKSAIYSQVNQFLGHEVPEQYIEQIKVIFAGNAEEGKAMKVKLFEEQRRINDVDYEYMQEQLKTKQLHDDQLKSVKQAKEKDLQEAQTRYDSLKRKHIELSQRKDTINYQLQSAMKTLEERQEELISLSEAKEQWQKKIDEDVSKIVQLKADLSEGSDKIEQLEHEVDQMQFENRNKLSQKEKLIELIPEIIKTSQNGGKTTAEMQAIMKSLPQDRNKQRLDQILHPKQLGAVN